MSQSERYNSRFVTLARTFAGCLLALAPALGAFSNQGVAISPLDGKLRVEIDGELFTEYLYTGYAKPVLFPIVGPHGLPMTRSYPLTDDVVGEARDHPHHKSLWFTHGSVNGIDFWGEGRRSGTIEHVRILHRADGRQRASLATENRWVAPDGKVVCTDVRELWFHLLPQGRAIDFRVTIRASHGDVVFGDTKEGTFGIRTHPNLRLTNHPPEVTTAAGVAVNSESTSGPTVWGQRAKWVDYSGPIDGQQVGIAMFDHPSNPRHPTWWHARDYGLVAANPFGVHDFENQPAGTGDLTIEHGGSLTFLYRVYFHEGDAQGANIAEAYEDFARDVPGDVLPQSRLPEDRRLGALRDLNGYFPMRPPTTRDEWQSRNESIRRRILVAAGLWPMPPAGSVVATVYSRVDRPEYSVEKVYLESHPGHFVTGNLYRPLGKLGPFPAVLCPHGHWDNGRFYDSGDEEVRRQIAAGAERFEVGGRYPLQARCVQLAKMGCIVFHYDMLGYADSQQIPRQVAHSLQHYRPEMDGRENWGLFSTQAELRLINVLGLQTYNSIRALDWLTSLPDVDPKRIAVTGASGGGTQTMLLAAIDPRVAVSMPAVMVSTSMQGGCTCENACCLRVDAGNVDFAALFAPKPLGLTAADDWTRELATKGLPELKQLYALLGAENCVMATNFVQFPHNYNYVNRAEMYAWFNQHLGLGYTEPIVEEDYQPLSIEEMSVWDDDHPRPPGGPEYEKSLMRELAAQLDDQLAALTPVDEASLNAFRSVVGGAMEVILNQQAALPNPISQTRVRRIERNGYVESHRFVEDGRCGTSVPVIVLEPLETSGQVAIVVHGEGKQALLPPDDALAQLLEHGTTVVLPDLFRQGDLTRDSHSPLINPKVENPRDFAGFTYGYNQPLFAQRTHDILTLVSLLRSEDPSPHGVHLVGLGGAGPYAAAARAICGEAIEMLAIDSQGFRFAEVASWRDRDFLPGAVKYGDLPALLALGAPYRLWLAGEDSEIPPLTRAAYHVSDGDVELFSLQSAGPDVLTAAVDWLLGQ